MCLVRIKRLFPKLFSVFKNLKAEYILAGTHNSLSRSIFHIIEISSISYFPDNAVTVYNIK